MKENVAKHLINARRGAYRRNAAKGSFALSDEGSESPDPVSAPAPAHGPLLKLDSMKRKLIDIVNTHDNTCSYVSSICKKMSSSSVNSKLATTRASTPNLTSTLKSKSKCTHPRRSNYPSLSSSRVTPSPPRSIHRFHSETSLKFASKPANIFSRIRAFRKEPELPPMATERK